MQLISNSYAISDEIFGICLKRTGKRKSTYSKWKPKGKKQAWFAYIKYRLSLTRFKSESKYCHMLKFTLNFGKIDLKCDFW